MKKTKLLESFHSKSITWAKYYLRLHLKHFLDEYSGCGRCGVEMALRSGVRGGSREPEAWACGGGGGGAVRRGSVAESVA
jgi:hypothetical protein